mgnify:CR=1 FL=1
MEFVRLRRRVLASTEPRSFERGDVAKMATDAVVGIFASTEPRSFERGDCAARGGAPRDGRASTEPRSFERGDTAGAWAAFFLALLQRSRALSSAEIRGATTRNRTRSKLQRSRALSSAEMPAKRTGGNRGIRFNGAALFRARRCRGRALNHHESLQASTEPRSFERGDRWGFRSKRRAAHCFNGAALFRARRSLRGTQHA